MDEREEFMRHGGEVKRSRASPELLAKLDKELGAVKKSIEDVRKGLKRKKNITERGRLARIRKMLRLQNRRTR